MEELAVVLGVLADRGVHAERVAVGLRQVHRGLAEPEGLAEGHRDDVHDRVELEAGMQLVGERDEAAQQLALAALGLSVPGWERHPAPSLANQLQSSLELDAI